MINVCLNGAPAELSVPTSIAQLLEAYDYTTRRVAVELNGEIVPRSQHVTRELCAGDRIEIVQAIGGG